MVFWLTLILLGIITYWVLQRSVSQMTRTPVWILWLVMMTPALIWSTWVALYGQKEPIPAVLVIVPFILCPLLYLSLVQWGRKSSDNPEAAKNPKQALVPPNAIQPTEENPKTRPIDRAEEANLRNCFPWTIYHLRNLEFRPQAVICRGQLRARPEVAYKTIREKIEEQFGDRFLVVFQNSLQGKPFFALVPNPYSGTMPLASEPITKPVWAFCLLFITLFTTTKIGAGEIGGISDAALQSAPQLLITGLPYSIALIAILGVHELGHYFAAQFYKIKATLPYFIPIPFFLGTLGAYTQMRSPIPNRKVLFDLKVAGPIAGFLITIPLLIWGLAHSEVVPLSAEGSGILNVDAFNPTFSFLLTLLSKLALGGQFTLDKAIDLHPVAVAGCVGLMVTALNLIPVGSLDGGHIIHAMFGQRTGMAIGQVSRFLFLILSFIHKEFLFLAILLFLLPLNNEPALNDVSELDNKRDFIGLLMLVLLAAIVLPMPKTVIQLLF